MACMHQDRHVEPTSKCMLFLESQRVSYEKVPVMWCYTLAHCSFPNYEGPFGLGDLLLVWFVSGQVHCDERAEVEPNQIDNVA